MEPNLSPYAEIALEALAPSPTNPRKSFADLEDLAASIREQGVMQPILARLWPEDYPTPEGRDTRPLYEIVAGERRYRASLLAGLAAIPALVRPLTTRQVLEAQIVENLQRRDVTELEEAEGYQLMMRDHGYTADQLAEKVGKSRAYIYGRLKLCALCEEARKAYRDGKLDASRALLIARIPGATLQTQAVKEITEGWAGVAMSYRQAAAHVQTKYMLKLASAPFDTGDAFLLIMAGDCRRCEKNTANARDLFPDVDADVCTDPMCWKSKKANAEAKRVELAKASGQRVIEGAEAKKIAPSGTHNLKGYARLDQQNYDAFDRETGTYRTNRDLLANAHVDTVLIRDPGTGEIVEAVEQSALAAAMKAAGIKNNTEAGKAREQEAAAAARKESAYRARLFDEIRTSVRMEINSSKTPSLRRREDLALIARQFWARIGHDAQVRLAKVRIQPGEKLDNHARVRMLDTEMREYNAGQLIELLFDLALVGMLDVPSYISDISTPAPLLDTARSFDIDPGVIRAGMDGKPAKKTASTPPQAAPAGEVPAETPKAKPAARAKQAAPARAVKPTKPKAQAAGAARKPKEKAKTSGRVAAAGGKGKPTDEPPPYRCPNTPDMLEGAVA